MSGNTVSAFRGPYIAFMRERKKTYCLMAFQRFNHLNSGGRQDRWYPWALAINPEHLTLHYSRKHALEGPAVVSLNIGSRFGGLAKIVQYTMSFEYLKWSPPTGETYYIPLLKKRIAGDTWTPSFTKNDHRRSPHQVVNNYQEYYTDQELWTVRARIQEQNLPLPQNLPPLVPRFTPSPSTTVPKLPSRIARLIAEDASKREEICPITMEPILVDTCKVTSCYHVFESSAIDHWLTTNNSCPVCKQKCSVVSAVC